MGAHMYVSKESTPARTPPRSLHSRPKQVLFPNLFFVFLASLSILGLTFFPGGTYISSLVILVFWQYVFLIYVCLRLRSRGVIFAVLFYPVLKFFYYSSYGQSWLHVGDFPAYVGILQTAFGSLGINLKSLLLASTYFNKFYYLTIFNIYAPLQLYKLSLSSSSVELFLFFNDFVFVFLTAFTVNAFKNVLEEKWIVWIVLFLLFSPTSLADTHYPDRHIFTLFALLWVVRGLIRIRASVVKFDFYLLLGLIVITINKPQLIMGVLLYLALDNYRLFRKKKYFLLTVLFVIAIFCWEFFFIKKGGVVSYLSQSRYQVATVSLELKSLLGSFYFIVMPFLKYVYAILSPFPWYNISVNLKIYADSLFPLVMSYLNTVFGVSIVIALVKYHRVLRRYSFYYRNFIFFGMVMSLTIIPSDIGHSGYLAIYYVLLFPLFILIGSRRSISIFFCSFLFMMLINFLYFLV